MALPNLSALSLKCSDPCGRCSGGAPLIGVRRPQPPDYKAPSMVDPLSEEYEPEKDNYRFHNNIHTLLFHDVGEAGVSLN